MTMNQSKTPAMSDADALLRQAADREASDVHLVPGYPVTFRVHGRLESVGAEVDGAGVRAMIESILPDRLVGRLDTAKNFDFSVALEHKGQPCRFRANTYLADGRWCACLRHVPNEIPSFEWMGFPQALAQRLVAHKNGLVIITGVTGSGKSTTLAALVNIINQKGGYRVITVEEPVEYVHRRVGSSLVTQREVGRDVDSFLDGLKYGLRQDPDVVQVGEIRDRDTAQMALTAAETGHLILTTLHTQDAKGAITRMCDLFPHDAQDDVRAQLALSLRSVVSQHLLPPIEAGRKRELALEILHVNQPVRVSIKWGKIDLHRLVIGGRITLDTARRFAKDPDGITAS
jgi:twitching motility protein PilT